MVKPEDIVRHELIGLEVRVSSSSNPVMVGLEGRVADESRNTLTIETAAGPKTAIKDQCEFSFRLPSGQRVKVDGKLLVARPEDRVRKKLKSW
jgi:ribonuclease P protein subunit POP4